MSLLLLGLAAALPLLPLIAGLLALLGTSRAPRLVWAAALAAVGIALTTTATVIFHGTAWVRLTPDSVPAVSLRLDTISLVMALLVTSLGSVILRFSLHYLEGDPRRDQFFGWMGLTLSAVLTLVLSGNLLLILLAWISTSLCLHQLLQFYPERAGAIFAARKKFVVSRLGDLCLLGVVIVIYRHYGTWELEALFRSIAGGEIGPLPEVGILLVLCASLKSALFPFHSWLPDTMETPTPVSAFMHAGIINAGGFLLIRLNPLLAHSPSGLAILSIMAAITAAFGATVMLAQPTVKRALAYSTIAQMGFMLLQCGLGAFGLALLHIVAHSLYKAHAFLHAGSTIGARSNAAIRLSLPTLGFGVLTGAILVFGCTTLWARFAPTTGQDSVVFLLILSLALAYGLARLSSSGAGTWSVAKGALLGGVLVLIALGLHATATALVPPVSISEPSRGISVLVGAVFVALFLFQALLWRSRNWPWGRRLYVHALNGFYVGTWANRALDRLWPRQAAR
jgi:NAD(P)H-quinone oxidoreductase subunit 5